MGVEKWRLVNAGSLPPLETQTIWHAGAIAVSEGVAPNTIFIDWPKTPLVGCGFHQEIEKEVDLDYCQRHNILVARRQIGGGAVYLNDGQIFYHVVVHKKTPSIPPNVADFYKVLLQAPIKTYRDLGIPAEYRPINDIKVGERKISGNGAGLIEDAMVLCGNLILTFDYDTMVKVLRVPEEKFRDKLVKSLRDWVTTVERELSRVPKREDCINLLVKNFEGTLNIELVPEQLTDREKILIKELNAIYQTDQWLYMPAYRHPELTQHRGVKVAEGVYVVEAMHKAPGGLIRVTLEVVEKRIRDILISGDFWFIPQQSLAELEKRLVGLDFDENDLLKSVNKFYRNYHIETPGVTPRDFVKSIKLAKQQIKDF